MARVKAVHESHSCSEHLQISVHLLRVRKWGQKRTEPLNKKLRVTLSQQSPSALTKMWGVMGQCRCVLPHRNIVPQPNHLLWYSSNSIFCYMFPKNQRIITASSSTSILFISETRVLKCWYRQGTWLHPFHQLHHYYVMFMQCVYYSQWYSLLIYINGTQLGI